MLESTPGAPYSNKVTDLLTVEGDMYYRFGETPFPEAIRPDICLPRRSLVRKHLKGNEIPLTLTSYPHLGVPGQFIDPYSDPADAVSSHSLFLPEEIAAPHPRSL